MKKNNNKKFSMRKESFLRGVKKQKFQLKVSAGFTFVEVLIYVALLAIVSGALFSYGLGMLSMREKSLTMRETIGAARFLEETLKREIRSAQSVDLENSIFDQENGKITLKGSDGEVVISSESDRVLVKRQGGDFEFLSPTSVNVKNFKLSREVSDNDQVQFVRFSFLVEANYPSSGGLAQYQYLTEINSGVQIRNQ